MSTDKRDTQFMGFSKLLWKEIIALSYDQCLAEGIIDVDVVNHEQETLISRRAYDLAEHILKDIQYDDEKYIDDHVRKLSDMIEWPKEEV